MINLTLRQKFYFALLVYLLIPLAGMSTDIYLPSLVRISVVFHAAKSLVQLTVTSYVLAIGLSQFIAGPISDAYGRKKLLLGATLLQLFAVIAILNGSSIYTFIVARFVQGLGAGFMLVPARAILNDIFEGQQLKKMFYYSTIFYSLGPIVAPFLGGYLQHYFDWQANFYFTLIYLVIVIAYLLFIYRETHTQVYAFALHHLWKNYQVIFSNKYFVLTTLIAGLAWGYSAVFNITAPFLVQAVLHYSPIVYGKIALAIGVAWFIGNSANRVLFKIDKKITTTIALLGTFITALIMLVLCHIGYFNLYMLVVPACIILILSGFIFPIYITESIIIFPNLPASANACTFTIVWLIFSGFTYLATFLKVSSLTPLAITYLGISIVVPIIYYILYPFDIAG